MQAQADANRVRELATGDADAILLKYTAEAAGIQKLYEAKAEGFLKLVQSCNGDTSAAARFLMIEKLESIVQMQTEAIKNIKIDKVQVWDSTSGNTQGFMSGLLGSLPPLNKVMDMAGLNMPEFLGTSKADAGTLDTTDMSGKVNPDIPFQSPIKKR